LAELRAMLEEMTDAALIVAMADARGESQGEWMRRRAVGRSGGRAGVCGLT
jgi:hypothetical protein